MEVKIEGGLPLKHFTRALTCLTRFGEDLDFLVTSTRCSISTVNSSRTAFAVIHLLPTFFDSYALLVPPTPSPASSTASAAPQETPYKFSVSGKALLSPLRPKNVGTIESCTITVGSESEDPNSRRTRLQPGVVDAGECRIVIRLNCQHGLVKTHRLTYSGPNVNNWARFDRDQCTASWKASSRILKEWIDHFYLRTYGNSAASATMTDEITFYCNDTSCRLKSFVDTSAEQNMSENDIMTSRPLTTELSVDTDDFDLWDLPENDTVAITFALKEFKAIINLSEALALPITCHFTRGGRPLMIEIQGDHLEAKFVVATTDYDSGTRDDHVKQQSASGQAIKREKGVAVGAGNGTTEGGRGRGGGGGAAMAGSSDGAARLFNPATPTPGPPELAGTPRDDEDDFDWGGFADADAAFAEIDHLSQAATASASQQQQSQQPRVVGTRVLVPDTSEPVASDTTTTSARRRRFEEEEAFGVSPEPEPAPTDETMLGPTQGYPLPRKKSKWNILDDE